MPCDEGCRTAVFGKTERTVGWEGNGCPVMTGLLRHCSWGNPQRTDRLCLPPLIHSFTLDLVICCAGDVEAPMRVLRQVLERLDLNLNESKTRIVDAGENSFDFLGFNFHLRRSRKSGKRYPHVEPSKRSVQRIKDRTKQLTDRRRTPIPLPQMIGELNRILRGWNNYFHHRNCSGVFSKVKMHVEERVRTQLRRRQKLISRAQAYQRFPGQVIYGRYGVFKLPTTAPWRSAHAPV